MYKKSNTLYSPQTFFFILLLCIVLLASCGGDNGASSNNPFAGNWTLTLKEQELSAPMTISRNGTLNSNFPDIAVTFTARVTTDGTIKDGQAIGTEVGPFIGAFSGNSGSGMWSVPYGGGNWTATR